MGEEDYKNLKRRITKVAEYKPYQKTGAVILCLMWLLFLTGMAMLVRESSYPKYMERGDVGFVSGTGEYFYLADSEALDRALCIDGQYVYLDRSAFGDVLRKNGMDGFWLGFGTYIKLPGIGDTPNGVYVDYSGTETELIIPYVDREKFFFEYVFKYFL